MVFAVAGFRGLVVAIGIGIGRFERRRTLREVVVNGNSNQRLYLENKMEAIKRGKHMMLSAFVLWLFSLQILGNKTPVIDRRRLN